MRYVALAAAVLLGGQTALRAADVAPSAPVVAPSAYIPDPGRFTLIEENDALAPSPQDRHYTQGARLSYLSGPIAAGGVWDRLYPSVPSGALFFDSTTEHVRRYEIILGQSLFTPQNLRFAPPDPTDRPYAGWLYGGVALLQETDRRSLENLELVVGVVGPSALGRQTQSAFHEVLGQSEPRGWAFQLGDEPGFMFSYDRKWRFEQPLGGGLAVDFIPEIGMSFGNVLTYASAGGMVRFGQNLGVDYGPARIRPALSGTTWFNPDRLDSPFGWYVFAGAQLRAVARNIFLDGNTFRDSPDVDKVPFVADISGGISFAWSDLVRLNFTVTQRTEEFEGQRGPDRFGGINLTVRLP